MLSFLSVGSLNFLALPITEVDSGFFLVSTRKKSHDFQVKFNITYWMYRITWRDTSLLYTWIKIYSLKKKILSWKNSQLKSEIKVYLTHTIVWQANRVHLNGVKLSNIFTKKKFKLALAGIKFGWKILLYISES